MINVLFWIGGILAVLFLLIDVTDLTSEFSDRPQKAVMLSAAEHVVFITIAVLWIRNIRPSWLMAFLLLLWFALLFAGFGYSRGAKSAAKET